MTAKRQPFNIQYIITGTEDGRWVCEARDRYERPIGNRVVVSTPSEAWRILMLLNGYATEPTQEINVPSELAA